VEDRLRVLENRVLREVLGSNRNKVTHGWRTLHKEEFHDLDSSQNIIWVIESRRMRLGGYVAYTRDR
jgi:hypothetical protein